MEFFKCSIAGVSYGKGVTEIERVAAARRSQACSILSPVRTSQHLCKAQQIHWHAVSR